MRIRVALTIVAIGALGVLSFFATRGGSPAPKVTSAVADARFAPSANAAEAQYVGPGTTTDTTTTGTDTTTTGAATTTTGAATTTTSTGTATTGTTATQTIAKPSVTVKATTTVTIKQSKPSTQTKTTQSPFGGGSAAGLPGSGTKGKGGATSSGTRGSSTGTGGGSNSGSPGGQTGGGASSGSSGGSTGSVSATGGPSAGQCGSSPWSSQTSESIVLTQTMSGDIGLHGASGQSRDGVSGLTDLPTDPAAANDVYSGSETVFGNSTAVGSTGIQWTDAAGGSRYVGYCNFWPVDTSGRWGFELYCAQSTPCHDVASARSPRSASDLTQVTVASNRGFTIPPKKLALVELRLNRAGRALLGRADGTLGGTLAVRSIRSARQPDVLSAHRNFKIFMVPCAVWGGESKDARRSCSRR